MTMSNEPSIFAASPRSDSEEEGLGVIKFGGPTLYDPVSLLLEHADITNITYESGV